MKLKIISIILLTVAAAVVFSLENGYGNFASAMTNNDDSSLTSDANKKFLSSCIVDDATYGIITRFEPLGCYPTGNMEGVLVTKTNDGMRMQV